MKIIITRHGETEENKAGIIQGHLPGKLTKEGIEQAKKLALRLKDEKIDAIYSSDLARAVDTTKEIIKFHPNVPVHFMKDLRERDMGEFQGKKKSEIGIDTSKPNIPFPKSKKGETREELCARTKKLIDDIYEKHKDGIVLIIGHGGANTAIASAITGETFLEMLKKMSLPNTSVTIFEIYEDKSHKIHCLNCTKHLNQNYYIPP